MTWTARKHAVVLGPEVSRTYLLVGVWTISLWFLYPIAWGLSEGGNVIAPDSEAIFYGILDILAKPVFGALLLWGHRNIDPAILGSKLLFPQGHGFVIINSYYQIVHIRDYDDSPTSRLTRGHHGEKTHDGAHGGVVDPAAPTAATAATSATTAPKLGV